MDEEEKGKIPESFIDRAFGVVYEYRDKLIKDEEYEEVMALDKLIVYIKNILAS